MKNEGISKTIQKQQEKPKGKAQKQSVISDRKLIDFKWPKHVPSFKPKTRKRYSHDVTLVSNANPDIGYVLNFSSEKKARIYMKAAGESHNDIEMDYERVEVVPEEDGYHK